MRKLLDLLKIANNDYYGMHVDYYDAMMNAPIEIDVEGKSIYKKFGGNIHKIVYISYGTSLQINSSMPLTDEQAVEVIKLLIEHRDVFIVDGKKTLDDFIDEQEKFIKEAESEFGDFIQALVSAFSNNKENETDEEDE